MMGLARVPTKLKLLDAAQETMLAKGYSATTVDEICAAAGLTKGSFFHYFKSKQELGTAVLDHFVISTQQMFHNAKFQEKRDPLRRVYGNVDFAIEMSRTPVAQQGCLLGNFAQELSKSNELLRRACAEHFAGWAQTLKKDLDAAKIQHAPNARLDTQSIAEHFIVVLEGALILAKSQQDHRVVETHLKHFKRYLKSLYGK